MNIYQAISGVMAEVGPISKDRQNTLQNYKFRGVDDACNALNPILPKYGIFFCPVVLSEKREERTSKNGGLLIYTILLVEFTVYAGDGSSVKLVMIGEAMDSGDKSANKAMSAAYKYAMLELFCIPTEDDKDTENHSPEPTPKPPVSAPEAVGMAGVPKCPKCTSDMIPGKGGSPYCVTCYKAYKAAQGTPKT